MHAPMHAGNAYTKTLEKQVIYQPFKMWRFLSVGFRLRASVFVRVYEHERIKQQRSNLQFFFFHHSKYKKSAHHFIVRFVAF